MTWSDRYTEFKPGDIIVLVNNYTDEDGEYDLEIGDIAEVITQPHWSSSNWLVAKLINNPREEIGLHKRDKRWRKK